MRRALLLLAAAALVCPAQDLKLPNAKNSVKFLVLGDPGTGASSQYETAKVAARYYEKFPFTFALLLGDNLYGGESERDFENKFEKPYKPLLDAGVKFYATLGNHDNPNQRFYKLFNMDGKRFYSFKKGGVRFLSLDSTYMGPDQLEWLKKELTPSPKEWTIAFFHHPLYSSGRKHGPDEELRTVLEPLFIQNGVDVVLCGHEHFYERLKPQQGIHHFILGNSGKLRKDNIIRNDEMAVGFDTDNAFMICEIDGDKFYFQVISRAGDTVDSGVIERGDHLRSATK